METKLFVMGEDRPVHAVLPFGDFMSMGKKLFAITASGRHGKDRAPCHPNL
jgi:hypothetical protein